MFRQRILIVAVTLLLHAGTAGIAMSQTGPLSNPNIGQPNTNVQRLDPVALLKVLEARDPDARGNWLQKEPYTYAFNETVRGVVHHVLVQWAPSVHRVAIIVTVSEPFSAERAATVEQQLPQWNKQIAPHSLEVVKVDGKSVLIVYREFSDSLSVQGLEAELNRVLESVATAQPLWANLR